MTELTGAQQESLDKTVACYEGDWRQVLEQFCERTGMSLSEAMLYYVTLNTSIMRDTFGKWLVQMKEVGDFQQRMIPLAKRQIELMEKDLGEDGDWKP